MDSIHTVLGHVLFCVRLHLAEISLECYTASKYCFDVWITYLNPFQQSVDIRETMTIFQSSSLKLLSLPAEEDIMFVAQKNTFDVDHLLVCLDYHLQLFAWCCRHLMMYGWWELKLRYCLVMAGLWYMDILYPFSVWIITRLQCPMAEKSW